MQESYKVADTERYEVLGNDVMEHFQVEEVSILLQFETITDAGSALDIKRRYLTVECLKSVRKAVRC